MDHQTDQRPDATGTPPRRPPFRVPIGLPLPDDEPRRGGWIVSVLVHALIIALLVVPFLAPEFVDRDVPQGAGGPGPAGGGGGGTGGTGGERLRPVQERLRYIQTVPAPTPTPPVEEEEEEEEEQKPAVPTVSIRTDLPESTVDFALTSGIGGGSGNDGSGGSGPGSGGGVGSGIGTGRGSSVGPGTGGGDGAVYSPVMIETFIPPLPVPERIKPYRIIAIFEVDERGRVVDFTFNESSDRAYNRRLRALLTQVKFRPATTPDGVPVKGEFRLEYDLY